MSYVYPEIFTRDNVAVSPYLLLFVVIVTLSSMSHSRRARPDAINGSSAFYGRRSVYVRESVITSWKLSAKRATGTGLSKPITDPLVDKIHVISCCSCVEPGMSTQKQGGRETGTDGFQTIEMQGPCFCQRDIGIMEKYVSVRGPNV